MRRQNLFKIKQSNILDLTGTSSQYQLATHEETTFRMTFYNVQSGLDLT